jgi:hypothetical protein
VVAMLGEAKLNALVALLLSNAAPSAFMQAEPRGLVWTPRFLFRLRPIPFCLTGARYAAVPNVQ